VRQRNRQHRSAGFLIEFRPALLPGKTCPGTGGVTAWLLYGGFRGEGARRCSNHLLPIRASRQKDRQALEQAVAR